MRRKTPSAELRGALRVMASREQRRAAGRGVTWKDRARLVFDDLARPMALPFAGGIFSTVLLFSAIAPFYPVHASNGFDIPIPGSRRSQVSVLSSDPTVLKTAPILAYSAGDVIVDVAVDNQGHMVDYTIVSGNANKSEALRRDIGAVLLLTEFNPAMTMGQPVSGKVRLSLSASHSSIDVKG
ncbi:MAG TPA: hypothetical protein VKS01_05930 [Bryobacteraceae bacterium]|nr:hypothetical protein [Bryobacteraceae bacterium]